MEWARVLFTVAAGIGGAWLAKKWKMPSAYMLGAMFAVAAFSILTGLASYPVFMKNFTQAVSGTFIGAGIRKKDLLLLRRMVVPAVVNVVSLLLFSLSMAVVLAKVTGFSFATAAFATAPGGLVDMAIVSLDMGADTAIVSVMQTVRLFSIIGLFPSIFAFVLSKQEGAEPHLEEAIPVVETKKGSIGATAMVGTMGGIVGYFLGMPAGPLIFSMFFVGAQNITTKSAVMPVQVKQIAQISAGTLIGSTIHAEAILALRHAVLPTILMVVGYILFVMVLGQLFYRTGQLSLSTALFACAPGGASDLSLLAIDYGANAAIVSLMQTIRMITVIALYPSAIILVNRLLG